MTTVENKHHGFSERTSCGRRTCTAPIILKALCLLAANAVSDDIVLLSVLFRYAELVGSLIISHINSSWGLCVFPTSESLL